MIMYKEMDKYTLLLLNSVLWKCKSLTLQIPPNSLKSFPLSFKKVEEAPFPLLLSDPLLFSGFMKTYSFVL